MNLEIEDCYRMLDLEYGADLPTVRQSYRQLVKVWHPDRFGNDQKLQSVAGEKLKKINLAYETIVEFWENGGTNRDSTPLQKEAPPKVKTPSTSEIYNLGLERYYAKDYKDALHFFLQSAEMGNANAQYAVGFIYYHHRTFVPLLGAQKHFREVLLWWTKAAEQDHTNAQYMIGTFHQLGFFTPYNETEARKWFERAASKGHPASKKWLNKSILRKLHAVPFVKLVMEGPPGAPMPT